LGWLLILPVHAADWIYAVVDGDNLWNLSERFLDSPTRFEALRRLNNIEQPTRMLPGTRLRVPMAWIRSNPVSATIDQIEGEALLVRGDGTTEPMPEPGTKIRLGDTLRTAKESSVAVRFADDSVLTLHSGSEIRFDHLSAHGETGMVDTRLHLFKGRLDTRVKPAEGPGSRFEIKTPSAVSAVRGTEFRSGVSDQADDSRFEVLGGKVLVSAKHKARLVPAGFGTKVALGKPPAPLRKLLPAPDLSELPSPVRQLGYRLRWPTIEKAVAYRAEIAREPAFDILLWEQLLDRPGLSLPDLADGQYHLRVRAIDEAGLEGINARTALHIDARPQPPVALYPQDGAVLRGIAAELKWSASDDADRYLLEIAENADFNGGVVRLPDLQEPRYTASQIEQAGTYHWRLSSIASDGEIGPPGVSRKWQLKPKPAKIDAAVAPSDDGLLRASWPAGSADLRYQAQLAHDREFKDIEIDRTTETAELSFEPLTGQVRFLRIRSIEADGYKGPWGTIQRIDPPPDKTRWMIPIIGALGILLL
jgi:hypothetical protein